MHKYSEIKRLYERISLGKFMETGNYEEIYGWWDIVAEYFTA